ncbi:hypothetical protein [Trichloromonas sp.]|uniref:hypothetical protein n=1 Tax=Trichloromonas sp. TaxID=3069249 RepID=UPI002A402CF1|nr:hypothetical protein [Trichloromonas sp.]
MSKEVYNIKEILYNTVGTVNPNYIIHILKTKKNVNVDSDQNYALRWASYYNEIEILKELLKFNSVNPLDFNYHAFELCIEKSNLEVFKILINDKRVKNKIDNLLKTIIYNCLHSNKLEILSYFLSLPDIKITDHINNLFTDFIEYNMNDYRYEILNMLLCDNRFDPSYANNKALKLSIEIKNYSYINILLKNKKVLSKIDSDDINTLTELKLIPYYKSKKIERTI